MNKTVYLKEILLQIPRILGNLNRNPSSSTCGSFDREYWHYKTTDFSCARKQETLLALALLYLLKDKENPYYKNPNILIWIKIGLKFWIELQNKDGSFAEWYPNEQSFGATAFSLYAFTETLLELENYIDLKDLFIINLEKTGDWLTKKEEIRAENQECGAIAGLYNLYLLTRKERFRENAQKKVQQLLKRQNKEGWLMEYNGADTGYLSLAIDYLAKYYSKSKDENALKILEKALGFIKYFLHPNHTSGGEYGSRNTSYLIPHGFELIKNNDADIIALFIRNALKKRTGIGLRNLDDRYLLYNSYTYLQAYCDAKKLKKTIPLFRERFTKHFKNAGIYIKSTDHYYIIINYFKNSFKIISKKTDNVLYDSGLEIETMAERLQFRSEKKELYQTENSICTEGGFCQIPDKTVTPFKTVGIRIFQSTFGKNDMIGLSIKEKLRDLLITNTKKKEGYKMRRGFFFEEEKVRILDEVEGKIKKIFVNVKSSYSYVPSSRYFETSELKNHLQIIEGNFSAIKIEREFNDKNVKTVWSHD